MNLKIGCCGFAIGKERYGRRFEVVEVQQTFYQVPPLATLQKWREALPAPFEFTVKAWQLITHEASSPTYRRLRVKLGAAELAQCGGFKLNPVVLDAWEATRQCAKVLQADKILFQCPARFTPISLHVQRMRDFFNSIDRKKLTLLWEPRGDWPPELIATLCEELDLVHVVDPYLAAPMTKGLIYLRLHGGKDFRRVFSAEDFSVIHRLMVKNQTAYVMFNNRTAAQDAEKFQRESSAWLA